MKESVNLSTFEGVSVVSLTSHVRVVFFSIFCCALSACGINTRDDSGNPVRLTTEEFAEYVETVFRYHNGVVNELILVTSLSDDPDLVLPQPLLTAEKLMVAKCQALNEMASATIEGRELSQWRKLLLIDHVPACSVASRRVEELIEQTFGAS